MTAAQVGAGQVQGILNQALRAARESEAPVPNLCVVLGCIQFFLAQSKYGANGKVLIAIANCSFF
jgi:hypothetical protein